MFKRFASLFMVLLFAFVVLGSGAADAKKYAEQTILTAAAADTSQTSDTFVVAKKTEKFLLYIDVTAGATLLLDLRIDVFLPGPNAWFTLIDNLPGVGGITGTGITAVTVTGSGSLADTLALDSRISIGGEMRVFVTHGNGNAATYKVYIQPM